MAEDGLAKKRIRQLADHLRVKPGSTITLPDDFDPGDTAGFKQETATTAQTLLASGIELLVEYQDRLAAQQVHALLVVLQGMDAAGKDSTIKHVMSGVNPQGVEVHSFKQPSSEELNHDYLWRYARNLPERGKIGIFNRSHYEEVLVVRVHASLLAAERLPHGRQPRRVWQQRFEEINAWERYLVANGIHVVKLFLNVSREEQRQRFLARIDRPAKNWKFTAADVAERAFWDDYQHAYSEVLSNTSTKSASWYVIPADHKWFERIAAAAVIADALIRIDPTYPNVGPKQKKELQKARKALVKDKPD